MGDFEPVATGLEKLLAGMQVSDGLICMVCRGVFDRLDREGTCQRCARARTEGEAILANLEGHVHPQLVRAGIGPRELTAQLRKVPSWISRVLPQEEVKAMLRGELPPRAFGIVGKAGSGKTFAMVAIMAEMARQRIRARAPRLGAEALQEWLNWLPWPETVNLFRVMSTRDGGIRDIDAAVKKAIAAEVLVLDDIGAERIRGEFQDDAAASKLDLIVDGRHRTMRPTWFTSNCHGLELRQRYGDRLYRRLTQDLELVTVQD